MLNMERKQIVEILKDEQYPEFMIDNTTTKLEKLSPVIAKAFEQWINCKQTPDLCIEGYSYTELVHNWGMKPIGAFITLDWLIREPEKAKKSLKKGIK